MKMSDNRTKLRLHARRLLPAVTVAGVALLLCSGARVDGIDIRASTPAALPFGTGLAPGQAIYLNADIDPALTLLHVSQRSRGFREAASEDTLFAAWNWSPRAPGIIFSGDEVTLGNRSAQTNSLTDLIGFWNSDNVRIIGGPDQFEPALTDDRGFAALQPNIPANAPAPLISGVATVSEWNGGAGNGLWTTSGNWTAGTPNAPEAVPLFGTIPTSPTSVAVNGAKTVGGITFDNTFSYSITGGATDTITLNNGIAAAGISVLSGNHTIAAPIILASNVFASTAAGTTLTFSGDIAGSKSFTSSGFVTFTGATHYSGPTLIAAGTLALVGDGSLANSATIRVGSAGKLNVDDVDNLFSIRPGQELVNNGEVRGHVDVFGKSGGSGLHNGIVYLESGAHLAPGDGTGTLTLALGLELSDGAVLDYDLGATSDLIRITAGTFVGSGAGGVTVNLLTGATFLPGEYLLIDWTGATAVGVEAADFHAGVLPPGGMAEFKVVGQTLRVNVVPEPGSAGLLGIGMLSLLGRRGRAARYSLP